jgi:hypothetical protein
LKATVEPSLKNFPALAGLRALWTIASVQTRRPGRKLLFWIGPGPGIPGTTGAFVPDGEGQLKPLADSGSFRQFTSGKKVDARKRDPENLLVLPPPAPGARQPRLLFASRS